MSWINRIFSKSPSSSTRKANVPEGVWTKCTACEQVLYSEELKRNMFARNVVIICVLMLVSVY